MRTLVFETYGNNEIRIGYNELPTRLKQSNDPEEVRQCELVGRQLDKSIADELSVSGQFQWRDSDGKLYRGSYASGYEQVDANASLLDILGEFQEQPRRISSEQRRGYGQPVRPSAFTRNARHRILEAGTLFDRKLSGDFKGYFVTFTLPGSSLEAYDSLSRWSGYLSNRVLQAVRDWNKNALWFYVWELQRRGALHMHLFVAIPNEAPSDILKSRLRDVWYRTLQSIGDKESVDMFFNAERNFHPSPDDWQFDFQLVEKTPAQYISKYVGKQAEAPRRTPSLEEGKNVYYPHRWWGMCRELKRLVDENRFQVCMDAIEKEFCMDAIECMDAMVQEFEPVAQYEYTADIGEDRGSGRAYGKVYRKIFYIRSEDFPIVDVLFRRAVIALMRGHDKENCRWRYNSTHYEGVPVWDL